MRTILTVTGIAGALALGGCKTIPDQATPEANAVLRDASGAEVGRAIITREAGRMRLTIEAAAQTPGEHGVHVHAVGLCEAPMFTSAGPHWNPAMKQHGRDNPMGTHMGDLPNLVVGPDGRGTLSAEVAGTMAELLDADGAAVIIHASPDDYRTDPSGNSGGRIACGVLTRR
jgi:superoxide dismutase, Cu-Zn family